MSEDQISVSVEPHKGHTDDEVVNELRKLGATDVEVIAEGFISAKLSRSKFKALEHIADVHEKQKHQPRRKRWSL